MLEPLCLTENLLLCKRTRSELSRKKNESYRLQEVTSYLQKLGFYVRSDGSILEATRTWEGKKVSVQFHYSETLNSNCRFLIVQLGSETSDITLLRTIATSM